MEHLPIDPPVYGEVSPGLFGLLEQVPIMDNEAIQCLSSSSQVTLQFPSPPELLGIKRYKSIVESIMESTGEQDENKRTTRTSIYPILPRNAIRMSAPVQYLQCPQ